jgi:tRNA(fMet)-specific endonuclease VapC
MRLLETNIVSYFFKKHSIGHRYFPLILGHDLVVSFQTVAELYEGALSAEWSIKRRERLDKYLEQYASIESTPVISAWWAYVKVTRKSQPISDSDAWIAATALAYDVELVTHNPSDFQNIPGLRIVTIKV